jgi:hypothetical protein
MQEQLDSMMCPTCGGTINVPKEYWYGGETQQPFKLCSCKPFPAVLYPDQAPGNALGDVQTDVYNLKRWMNVLGRLLPQGNGKSYSVGPYMAEDLHNQGLALPEHVLKGLLKSVEKELRLRHNMSGTELLFVKVCLYCGHVEFSHSGGSVGEIRLLNYELCQECRRVRGSNPETFKWISRVIKFGYVRAPEQMMPIMPPPPPPAASEPFKAITLDE